MFPILLEDAIAHGDWKDPGSEALRMLLGLGELEDELELYETRKMMEHTGRQLDVGGYVDAPTFCMVRDPSDREGSDDPRLIYSQLLFIGGAIMAGDDVFLAVDISKPSDEQTVFWFDWSRKPPHRWTPIMSFSSFLDALRTAERIEISHNEKRKRCRLRDDEDFLSDEEFLSSESQENSKNR